MRTPQLYDLKLVPRDSGSAKFTDGSMTVQLDASGSPEVVTGLPAMEQDVLKAMFTRVRPDGYGTLLHGIVGEKNLGVVQAMGSMSTIGAMKVLTRIHASLRSRYPVLFPKDRCLKGVDIVKISQQDGVSTTIKLEFHSVRGDQSQQVVDYNGA